MAVFTSLHLMKGVDLSDPRAVSDSHAIPRAAADEEEFRRLLGDDCDCAAPIGDLPLDYVSHVLFDGQSGGNNALEARVRVGSAAAPARLQRG